MLDDAEEKYFEAESGGSSTKQIKVSDLKKNGHIVIKGRPCKIVEISSVDQSPVKVVALDIFTLKKLEDSLQAASSVDEPVVTRKEYTLVDIGEDGFCSLALESGDMKDDVSLPTDEYSREKLRDHFDSGGNVKVTVLSAMGEEHIIESKVVSNS